MAGYFLPRVALRLDSHERTARQSQSWSWFPPTSPTPSAPTAFQEKRPALVAEVELGCGRHFGLALSHQSHQFQAFDKIAKKALTKVDCSTKLSRSLTPVIEVPKARSSTYMDASFLTTGDISSVFGPTAYDKTILDRNSGFLPIPSCSSRQVSSLPPPVLLKPNPSQGSLIGPDICGKESY